MKVGWLGLGLAGAAGLIPSAARPKIGQQPLPAPALFVAPHGTLQPHFAAAWTLCTMPLTVCEGAHIHSCTDQPRLAGLRPAGFAQRDTS